MRFFLVLYALTVFFITPAMAQNEQSIVKPGQTVLNISANERQMVQQDQLIASVRYEIDGDDPKTLQSKINAQMAKALEAAKKHPDVKVSTDNYYVYPYNPDQYDHPDPDQRLEHNKKKSVIWRGAQGLQLTSKNSEELLELLGKLQAMGLQTNNLSYTLSTEVFEKVRDSLMESALKKLSEKADHAAKALGKKDVELVEVNVDAGYPQAPVMMMRAEMSGAANAKMDMPVASPGESEIVLTVSARAILK